jgi:hypothetical protein
VGAAALEVRGTSWDEDSLHMMITKRRVRKVRTKGRVPGAPVEVKPLAWQAMWQLRLPFNASYFLGFNKVFLPVGVLSAEYNHVLEHEKRADIGPHTDSPLHPQCHIFHALKVSGFQRDRNTRLEVAGLGRSQACGTPP